MISRRLLVVGLSCCALATACSSGGGGPKHPVIPTDANSVLARLSKAAEALTSSPTAGFQPKGQPTGKIRIVNAYDDNGTPGGPMDLYDMLRPASSDTPIISNLAYGAVSDYVSPRAADPGGPGQLWIYPAGSLQPSGAYTGGNISNAGWTADEQVTVVLGPSTMSGSFSESQISDANSTEAPLPTASAPAGQATLSTLYAGQLMSDSPAVYLTVDGACVTALGGDANLPSNFATGQEWAVPAGTHTLGIFGEPHDKALTFDQCKAPAKSPVATVSVDASAGGRIDVIVYGSSPTDLKVVAAPVS